MENYATVPWYSEVPGGGGSEPAPAWGQNKLNEVKTVNEYPEHKIKAIHELITLDIPCLALSMKLRFLELSA